MTLCVAIGPSSFGEADDAPLRMLRDRGIKVKPNPFGRRLTEAETIAHAVDADGLLAGLEPLTRAVFAASPRLRAVARVGIGTSNVDFTAAAEFGVRVSNTPEPPAQAVAEMTMAALLALCRNLALVNTALHAGRWEKRIGMGLAGARVLLVGCGRIGRRVAALLQAFGATVWAFDPRLQPHDFPVGVSSTASLADGLAWADVVSLHASGAACILDTDAFRAMRKGALLLNSARGELVDEEALLAALESGTVRGAWFDAFVEEPYSGPLIRYEQVLLTPHTATYTRQCRRAMEAEAVAHLLRDLGIED